MAQRDSESTAFSLGQGARIGKIEVGGHIAGHDVVIRSAPKEALSAHDLAQLLDELKGIEDRLGTLADAPAGLRDDAHDELRKAHLAGAEGDTQRLVEKLGTAQGYLERIGQALPAAVTLAQNVATLALRIGGQS